MKEINLEITRHPSAYSVRPHPYSAETYIREGAELPPLREYPSGWRARICMVVDEHVNPDEAVEILAAALLRHSPPTHIMVLR